MGKSFKSRTAARLAGIEQRLRDQARATQRIGPTPPAAPAPPQPETFTLAGLLEEAGFYDRAGGVDEALAAAEAAADANTARPPTLENEFLHLDYDRPRESQLRPLGYRNFFPSIDYSSVDRAYPVFLTDYTGIHNNNAHFALSQYGYPDGSKPMRANRTASVFSNINPVYTAMGQGWLEEAAANRFGGRYPAEINWEDFLDDARKNPFYEKVAQRDGQDWAERVLLAGLLAENMTSGVVPPHVVIGHRGGNPIELPGSDKGVNFYPTLFHEMTHGGLLPEMQSLYEAKTVSPGVIGKSLNDESFFNDALGMLHSREIFTPEQIAAMNTPPGPEPGKTVLESLVNGRLPRLPDARSTYRNLLYRTVPQETDTVLADIKRAWAEHTGELVNTPEAAERALTWFAEQMPVGGHPLSRGGQENFFTVGSPLDAQYYLSPDIFSADSSLGKETYLARMTEVLGLGGVAALAGLLGEKDENRGSIQY